MTDHCVTHSDLVEIAKRNGDFKKNYGLLVGAILYLRSIDAARPRSSWWQVFMAIMGVCKHIYARVGRGAVAVFDVESNDQLHRILNEWADIIPAHFETFPLVDVEATKKLLAAQISAGT
jgi:hypothetical protein